VQTFVSALKADVPVADTATWTGYSTLVPPPSAPSQQASVGPPCWARTPPPPLPTARLGEPTTAPDPPAFTPDIGGCDTRAAPVAPAVTTGATRTVLRCIIPCSPPPAPDRARTPA